MFRRFAGTKGRPVLPSSGPSVAVMLAGALSEEEEDAMVGLWAACLRVDGWEELYE